MMETFFIFAIGLIPAFFSVVLMRKAEVQAQERLQTAMTAVANRHLGHFYGYPLTSEYLDHQYVEGVGYMFGDLTCRYNARSPYLRCAINPCGPCKECPHYESIEFN